VIEQHAHFGPSVCIAAVRSIACLRAILHVLDTGDSSIPVILRRVTLRNADAPLVRPEGFPMWSYMRGMRGFRSLLRARICLPRSDIFCLLRAHS
jgi:hypothetical protein